MRAPALCATSATMPRAAAFSISTRRAATAPIRLDFFGDTLESIRAFDPETQRSTTQQRSLDLVPMSEARLTTELDPPLPSDLRCSNSALPRRATIFTPR